MKKSSNDQTVKAVQTASEVQSTCDPDHYKADKVETIEILEEIISNPKRRLTPKQRWNVAQAVRYLLRLGLKGDTFDAEKDLQKAENYVHRALTGSWIPRESLTGSNQH